MHAEESVTISQWYYICLTYDVKCNTQKKTLHNPLQQLSSMSNGEIALHTVRLQLQDARLVV